MLSNITVCFSGAYSPLWHDMCQLCLNLYVPPSHGMIETSAGTCGIPLKRRLIFYSVIEVYIEFIKMCDKRVLEIISAFDLLSSIVRYFAFRACVHQVVQKMSP